MELAVVFSISVLACAVMSNNLHVVVRVDPETAARWSDDDLAHCWVRLFPARVDGDVNAESCRRKASVLTGNAERVAMLRKRLSDWSWFMRCLSEPMARGANLEDRCTGRFWEGRYRCHSPLDDGAVLACMTYVDLNPVRAGVADTLRVSPHTSILRRLQAPPEAQAGAIRAIAGPSAVGFLPLSEMHYIGLVDCAGRQLRPGNRGHIANDAPPSSHRGFDIERWLRDVRGVESRFCRTIGSAQALLDKARQMGQRWLMVRRVERVV